MTFWRAGSGFASGLRHLLFEVLERKANFSTNSRRITDHGACSIPRFLHFLLPISTTNLHFAHRVVVVGIRGGWTNRSDFEETGYSGSFCARSPQHPSLKPQSSYCKRRLAN